MQKTLSREGPLSTTLWLDDKIRSCDVSWSMQQGKHTDGYDWHCALWSHSKVCWWAFSLPFDFLDCFFFPLALRCLVENLFSSGDGWSSVAWPSQLNFLLQMRLIIDNYHSASTHIMIITWHNGDDRNNSSIPYNYPPKGRWIVVDIYWDAKRRGIYPPLFTDPEGNSCFSIYLIRWIKKCCFNFFFWNFRETTRHFSFRSQNSE